MLKNRIITGSLALAFFVGTILFAPAWMLVILTFAVYFLAQLEYCEMCEAGGYKLERVGIFVCGFLFLGATVLETDVYGDTPLITWLEPYFCNGWSPTEYLYFFIPAFLGIQSVLRRKTERAAEHLGLSILGFWYIAVLMSFMVRSTLQWNEPLPWNDDEFISTVGRTFLIFFILVVKMSDIGAYAFGVLWGDKIKRRLIPEISPKKSIPGLFGAYVGSLLVVIVCASVPCDEIFFTKGEWCTLIVFGFLMATVGVLGDLVESLLKRSFGVKDSSSRFPGMGGFLDMLDSLLFAAPFMYFFVLWFM
jgi:phosphatidate cytidylyltransferase